MYVSSLYLIRKTAADSIYIFFFHNRKCRKDTVFFGLSLAFSCCFILLYLLVRFLIYNCIVYTTVLFITL